MKQQLLKVLFVCMAVVFLPQVAHAVGDIRINAKNFPDKNFRRYLLKQDYGKDGKLTEAEIKNVKEMYIDSLSISSLQGIEYFTALELLFCGQNRLTALDVSKNTALVGLFCSGNQLTSLDVSRCKTLTELACDDNQLISLDVSGCTALTALCCERNQLTALDVSGCISLTWIMCCDSIIKEASMDNLIKSLPTQKEARLCVHVYSSFSSDEGNVCTTKEQNEAMREKGWMLLYCSE